MPPAPSSHSAMDSRTRRRMGATRRRCCESRRRTRGGPHATQCLWPGRALVDRHGGCAGGQALLPLIVSCAKADERSPKEFVFLWVIDDRPSAFRSQVLKLSQAPSVSQHPWCSPPGTQRTTSTSVRKHIRQAPRSDLSESQPVHLVAVYGSSVRQSTQHPTAV